MGAHNAEPRKQHLDKLDRILSEDEYRRLGKKFRSELTDMEFEMEKVKQEKGESIDSARRLLELAQKIFSLYVRQVSDEKRKLRLICLRNPIGSTKEKRSLPVAEVTFMKFGVPYRI